MEAKELRIGNLIYNKGKIIKIAQLLADCAYNEHDFQSYRYDELEPIPLTEEWLLNFSFEKRDVEFQSYTKKGIQINYIDGNWLEYARRIEIESVHQLQNLYFALTGEELQIK